MMADYWRIFAQEVPSDMGIQLTPEQTNYLTDALKGAHENFGTAHGHECIPNPMKLEVSRLEKLLKDEKAKIFCTACLGRGSVVSHGPVHSCHSTCWKCNGEGRHKP